MIQEQLAIMMGIRVQFHDATKFALASKCPEPSQELRGVCNYLAAAHLIDDPTRTTSWACRAVVLVSKKIKPSQST
jgi:hypothetical protein